MPLPFNKFRECDIVPKKIGRPLKSNVPLIKEVKARIDEETFKKLNDYCEKNNIQRATAIRIALERLINSNV